MEAPCQPNAQLSNGVALVRTYALSIIVSLWVSAVAAAEPTFFVVPLHGEVGVEIAAKPMAQAFKTGLLDPKTVLILDIDSPGGSVAECEKIIDLLAKETERRTIASVRQGYSAAAIIALLCDEIYMEKNASIGAATAIITKEGKTTAVDEKMQSVWRSTCRRAAEIGGHNPLFAEAMVDASPPTSSRQEEREEGSAPGSEFL